MSPYPIMRLGQALQPISQPLQTAKPSILTNPQGAVSSTIANVEDYVAQKLKDQNIKSMLIGGGIGLLVGLIAFPIGQSLMGYSTYKKSDLPPQDFAY